MFVDMIWDWIQKASMVVLTAFDVIFPEYPKVGFAVIIASLIFLAYYLLRGEPKVAVKMTGSLLVFFVVLLYSLHWIIKLYRVMI